MSLDNAALITIDIPREPVAAVDDDFSTMTDRELAEYTARTLSAILGIANDVKGQVAPVLDSVSKNPMLKMLFK